ncbi:MAG: DNA polymerase I, partial [Thermodesulfobacteriota bacterium]
MPKQIYLIDGSSYIYRAYHALTPLSNSRGFPTHAIYGVTNMILKILREKKPDYIAVVFDAKGPTFRHKESPTYKANRPTMPEDLSQQIPYIKKIIQALGITFLEKEGYEADDIIATLCKQFAHQDVEIVLVSGDKDLWQLLSSKTKLWDSMRDKILEERDILGKYKLPPSRLKEVMALTGDKIDNIPGVPKVGEKTAIKLIQEFGSLDNLLANIEKVKSRLLRENLLQYKNQVLTNLKLVSLDEHVPLNLRLQHLSPQPIDRETLIKLFTELDFKKLLRELLPEPSLAKVKYECVLDKQTFKKMIKRLKTKKSVALEVQTTERDPISSELVGISFCCEPGEAWYIPLKHFYLGVPSQLPLKEVLEGLREILEDGTFLKVGQEIKHTLLVLRRYGVELKGVYFDTMVAAYVLQPGQTSYNLEELAQTYLKVRKKSYKELVSKVRKPITFSQVPLEKAKDYACEKIDIILRLKHILAEKIETSSQKALFQNIELPLIPVLADMQWWGVKIDSNYLRRLSNIFSDRLRNLERRIFKLAGEEFNISSPAQLRHILFEKLKLPVIKKTRGKTGYSTDAEVLNSLAVIHPLPQEVINYRNLMKLKSGYIDALPKMVNPQTGRIHTSYNQTVTATGRLSSSEPNLQNIPTRGEDGKSIRCAFIPETGWLYLAADYSQIELRLLAHFSDDVALIEAFHHGEDIHSRTASEIFQVKPQLVTPDMRRQAKVINFGIIYGMSPYGLSKELGIDVATAKKYIEEYFARYPGVNEYIENSLNKA